MPASSSPSVIPPSLGYLGVLPGAPRNGQGYYGQTPRERKGENTIPRGSPRGRDYPVGVYPRGGPPGPQPRPAKAGITSRANHRSCSLNSAGGMPPAEGLTPCSSPG